MTDTYSACEAALHSVMSAEEIASLESGMGYIDRFVFEKLFDPTHLTMIQYPDRLSHIAFWCGVTVGFGVFAAFYFVFLRRPRYVTLPAQRSAGRTN